MKNWIETYQLENGDFDISDVNKELVSQIPSAIQMGKVYQRLIVDTAIWNENYVDEIYRVYNSDICDIIDRNDSLPLRCILHAVKNVEKTTSTKNRHKGKVIIRETFP